jgi:hypothetical protein
VKNRLFKPDLKILVDAMPVERRKLVAVIPVQIGQLVLGILHRAFRTLVKEHSGRYTDKNSSLGEGHNYCG